MAKQEVITRNGSVVGIGESLATTPIVRVSSPWVVEAIVSSFVGAAAGWVIEEVVRHARGRRR